jgi:cell division protein FtsB
MRLPRHRTTPQRRKAADKRVGRDQRPAVQRRTRNTASRRPAQRESAQRSRRTGVTSRAAVLAIAVCAVVLTLAVPFQQYIAQRGQLGSLAAQERAERARVAALEQAQARWDDPSYVRQQARERLHFVKPGETAYLIVDPTPRPQMTATPTPKAPHRTGAWYSQLWSTVTTAADEPTTKKTVKPKPPTPKPITPPVKH